MGARGKKDHVYILLLACIIRLKEMVREDEFDRLSFGVILLICGFCKAFLNLAKNIHLLSLLPGANKCQVCGSCDLTTLNISRLL